LFFGIDIAWCWGESAGKEAGCKTPPVIKIGYYEMAKQASGEKMNSPGCSGGT
jgi:hypothetical protein